MGLSEGRIIMSSESKEYQYWSKKADSFDAANTYIVGQNTFEAAQNWLKEQLTIQDNVLEIGCGTGIFSAVIAESVRHLTATDMSEEMLAKTRLRLQKYSNVEVKPADGYQLAHAESTFDVAFMGNVLHIVKEPSTILKESYRTLRKGGRLLAMDYTLAGMTLPTKLAMIIRYVSKLGMPPRDNKSYRSEELAQLLQQAGFTIQDAQTIKRESNVICLKAVKR